PDDADRGTARGPGGPPGQAVRRPRRAAARKGAGRSRNRPPPRLRDKRGEAFPVDPARQAQAARETECRPGAGVPAMARGRDRGVLPLSVQNAYRERYRAIRPGWKSSGDQLEAMVRSHVTARSRILDLGCGRGGVVELLWREVELAAGLDPDSPSLSEHRAQGMPVVRGVGERMPFVDESFDLIVCLWVLEHLKDPVEAFREVRRVLRPRGHFVFVTP